MAALAVTMTAAATASADCGELGCVILVEVDGLEPGDVTRTSTPFMWALGNAQAGGGSGDPAGTAYSSLLQGRNGFMWQAGRSPMTAATAPSALSLLSGANPDQHGILADEMLPPLPRTDPSTQRLRALNDAGGGAATKLSSGDHSTLLELVATAEEQDPEAWAFVGDPALALMLDGQLAQTGHSWSPTVRDGGDPALCPLPRALPGVGGETADDAPQLAQRDCPARDATTLRTAFQDLTESGDGLPLLTYVHLAELGRMKQLHGDAETATTLGAVDAALAAFAEGLANHPETALSWDRTLLVVTGNHGYEPTPLDRRVPHPDRVGDGEWDLSDFVREQSTGEQAVLVPQGTIATVHAPAEDVEPLAAAIAAEGDRGCRELAGEDCIDEVVPVAALAELHQTWALNPLTADGTPTGAGGQLVVTLKPGWAFGRVTERRPDPLEPPEAEATNPYPGSAGGPRNRAIAVLMNGPTAASGLRHTLRQGPAGGQPVTAAAQTPPACAGGAAPGDPNDPATMADDAAAPGHECQPETVDIALSIAGLLKLDTEGVPLAPQGRYLNEAFTPPLGIQEVEEEPQPEIPEPEPPPPPEPIVITRGSVQVITPPPPKDPFPYRGLVRRLRVRVTDAAGRPFKRAGRGTPLSTIQVQGDFGRPESLVTLTFYRRKGKGRRARLSAIARFKPFAVKRGPVRLRLRIPRRFRPTHLGVSVQQVETLEGGVKKPVGNPGGGIARIKDARRLHTRKGARRARRGASRGRNGAGRGRRGAARGKRR